MGDVRDGMALPPADVAPRPFGVPPVGTGRPGPPVAVVAEVDRPGCLVEDERAGDEQLRVGVGVVVRMGRVLRPGDMAGVLHESPELGDRHRVSIDPEPPDRHLADGTLLRIEVRRAHPEPAAGQLDHVLEERRHGHRPALRASAKTVFQSFLMLTTVQPSAAATSSDFSAPAV